MAAGQRLHPALHKLRVQLVAAQIQAARVHARRKKESSSGSRIELVAYIHVSVVY
jgi:hypothetical protein